MRLAKGGFNPQFSPDGRRITFWTGAQVTASTPSKIFIVPATGGAPEEIQTGLPFSRHPVWTPDGTRLLFWGADGFGKADWYTVDAVREGGRSQRPVSLGWIESVGHLPIDVYPWAWIGQRAVFLLPSGDAHDLWSILVSPRNWRATGPIERLTAGLDSAEHPGVSLTGRAVWAKVQTKINVWSLAVDANTGRVKGEWQQTTIGISRKQRPNLSRNGKRAVFNDGPAIALMELSTGKETIIAASGLHASLTADRIKGGVRKGSRQGGNGFIRRQSDGRYSRKGLYWVRHAVWRLVNRPAEDPVRLGGASGSEFVRLEDPPKDRVAPAKRARLYPSRFSCSNGGSVDCDNRWAVPR